MTDRILAFGAVAAALLAIIALIGAAWRCWRRIDQLLVDPVQQMWTDWQGAPGRPGVPARPGVMERLADMDGRLRTVEHQVCPNGGGSMHDKISAVKRAVVDS